MHLRANHLVHERNPDYGEKNMMTTIKIHYGGVLVHEYEPVYVGGTISVFDWVSVRNITVSYIKKLTVMLGYVRKKELYHLDIERGKWRKLVLQTEIEMLFVGYNEFHIYLVAQQCTHVEGNEQDDENDLDQQDRVEAHNGDENDSSMTEHGLNSTNQGIGTAELNGEDPFVPIDVPIKMTARKMTGGVRTESFTNPTGRDSPTKKGKTIHGAKNINQTSLFSQHIPQPVPPSVNIRGPPPPSSIPNISSQTSTSGGNVPFIVKRGKNYVTMRNLSAAVAATKGKEKKSKKKD